MAIILKDVSYTYNEGLIKEKKAITDINFEFVDNKIYGITGKSGSGKSTLVKLICSYLSPTKGKVIKELNKKNIGMVTQFVEEQILMNKVKEELDYSLMGRTKSQSRMIQALNMVGLSADYLNRNPRKLSSGEKRLVYIAISLVISPKLLILDEPALGLDRINKMNIIRTLKRINNKYGVTIIIVSHDIEFLNQLIDDLIILEDGKILTSGKKDEVFKKISFLNRHGIEIPKILSFINTVRTEKKIKLEISNDVRDLIKEVYRNV